MKAFKARDCRVEGDFSRHAVSLKEARGLSFKVPPEEVDAFRHEAFVVSGIRVVLQIILLAI